MKNKFIYLSVLVFTGLVSCEPEFENSVDSNYSAGEADFSSYVAIGNSLTAGYMDGTVSKGSQANSFPNLLSQQFATVGGGVFTQPSYEEDVNNLGGISGIPGFGTRLVINASVGAPQPIAGTSTITLTPQATAYNNMGVPGAKSFHLLAPGYGNAANLPAANPYYVRHATSLTSTVLGDAVSKNPTFFTNWIGANDILSYATSGGAKSDGSPADDHNVTGNTNPATYGINDITNSAVFAGTYSMIIDQLTANGAKGVVCTIPSVTSIPYFTTVPYNPLSPTALGGSANINALNAQLYGPLNGIFSALGEPNRVKLLSATSANPILIYDADAADRTAQITAILTPQLGAPTATAFGAVFGKARQATAADLIVLPASSVIGTPNASSPSTLININGVSYPMANRWVLTSTEAAKVASATVSYNASIKAIASSKNLAVADMNAILGVLVNGLRSVNGQIYTANYFSGSATEGQVLFSLDGVHPNARGYAVIANEILKVINTHYKSNIPFLNPSYFPGINIVATN